MPAYPAYFLLFASLPLLVPGVLSRIKRGALPSLPRSIGRRTLIAVGVLFVALPLVAVAAPQQLDADNPQAVSINTILTPVDEAIRVTVTPEGARRTVTWEHPGFGPTKVFYKVYRTEFQGEDVECSTTRSPECVLKMITLATTRNARYVDLSPPEDALYRIGIATNWQNDPAGGDVISISTPIAATP
jgi:hypothetical protein